MKVVFLQDIPRVAHAGDIKDVADGYARNFLLPRQLAAQADPKMMNAIEARLRARARVAVQEEEEMTVLATELDGSEITLRARAGVKDRLYGSVTAADIAAEIENITGWAIDRRKIELDNPIRQLGTYEVPIHLARDIVATVRLTVAEKES